MKKKLGLGCATLLLLSACSAPLKEDATMSCYLMSTMEEQTFLGEVAVGYNKESGIALSATYQESYDFLEKNETNNSRLSEYISKRATLSEVEGAEINLEIEEVSFVYHQVWDYAKVNIEEAVESDENQLIFIDGENYSVEKIREYYEEQHYSCMTEDKE